jgi:hypothetical protein
MRIATPVLVLVAVLIAGAVVWLRATTTFERAESPSALTVAELYRAAERELRQHDGVYQATVEVVSDFGLFSSSGTITRWADVRSDASREESNMTPSGSSVMITTRDGRYWRDVSGRISTSPARYWTCNGVGIAASALLGCPGPTERSTVEVRTATREGQPVIVLVTTGTISGSDETYAFTRRLYLDPATYLPIALEGDGQIDFGRLMPAKERHRFQHRFVSSGAVAKDLFDPASIGYAPTDPARALDRASADMHVYWLGSEFAAASSLPALVLSKIDAPEHGPGYRYLLYYSPRDDRYAPPVASLQLWPRPAWDAVLRASRFGNVWDDPCWTREELSVPRGTATIFSGFAGEVRIGAAAGSGSTCPLRPYDAFLAHVYLGDSVVMVSAPGMSGVRGMTKSPYDTRDGIEALVRGLRQR